MTIKILKLLRVKFNREFVINSIRSKVNYPSLASVNAAFKEMNLDTASYRADVNDLESISYPVVSQMPGKGFIVLNDYDRAGKTISYYTLKDSYITESIGDFESKWSGIVLEVEKNGLSGERHYYRHKLAFFKTHLFIAAISILFFTGCQMMVRLGITMLLPAMLVLNSIALMVAWIIFLKESLPGTSIWTKYAR